MSSHPCQKCGACCALYRVSFHWSETLSESHNVPPDSTVSVSPHHLAMKGTNAAKPYCQALEGIIGESVSCRIYAHRPSCCREFSASFENGIENKTCAEARLAKGLTPLTLADW